MGNHRNILSRRNSPRSLSSSRNSSISVPVTVIHQPTKNSCSPLPSLKSLPEHHQHQPQKQQLTESDAECWKRMLDLQMEYHCYNSARLEAAVEARNCGVSIEEIRRPSRLCLDLLNDELRTQLENEQWREP